MKKDMKLKGEYSLDFPFLEANVREGYVCGVERLGQAEDFESCLKAVRSMFNSLNNSHSPLGRAGDWAIDMIHAYRTAGKILGEVIESYPSQSADTGELKRQLEGIEKAFL